jgi:hypothetical protein
MGLEIVESIQYYKVGFIKASKKNFFFYYNALYSHGKEETNSDTYEVMRKCINKEQFLFYYYEYIISKRCPVS